jgi:hypothetical protein
MLRKASISRHASFWQILEGFGIVISLKSQVLSGQSLTQSCKTQAGVSLYKVLTPSYGTDRRVNPSEKALVS